MLKIIGRLVVLFWLPCAIWQQSLAGEISGIRFWQDPEKTRLVFDVSDKVDYHLFSLPGPDRLVIDIEKSKLKIALSEVEIPQSLVSKIRSSHNKETLRLVVDLKKKVNFKHFLLKPIQSFGHRLVVDLYDKSSKKQVVKIASSTIKNKNRDIVIAIDAGHGGEDPGAPGGEKGVTLAVAKRLAKAINAEKGLKAILTRNADYFVDLRKRTDIARKNKADLFISLHADGFHDKRVKGTSVWVLSPKGANSEMGLWLEQKEKVSDLAGGIDISHKDPLVAQVLLDLSMHYSVGASLSAGELVRKQLARSMPKMHGKGLNKAAFVVLRMPDIPAMLVEMGFISNPQERKQLKNSNHQKKISNAILAGVKSYFRANPPDGSYYASLGNVRSYRVKNGDTLSEIAQNHGISMSSLKSHNKLKSDGLKIGQKLLIPEV